MLRSKRSDHTRQRSTGSATLIAIQAIAAFCLLPSAIAAQGSKLIVGLGIGIPYGMHGANAEYRVIENGYVSGGIGTTLLAGPGYSVGARYYINGMDSKWRPRVGLFYGTTTVAEGIFADDKSFSGLTVTAGQVRMLGIGHRHGLDLDLLLVFTEDDRLKTLENLGLDVPGILRISVGYRYGI